MKLPINETRKFKSGILNNKIKYTIINDEMDQVSNVSICVNAGSINEPREFPGLAHFLEHMLFLGSKKYPQEDYFDEKIKQYGGFNNAYTSLKNTVYYFNVLDDYLDEILEIFSRFFIDPLFDEDSVMREINAVDSEHNKNKNNDVWIRSQIIKNLSKKDSPINVFSTGNIETLNKENIRENMIEFYKKYYTPNNISIVITSPRDIDIIEKIITDIFNTIPKSLNVKNSIVKKENYFDKQLEYVLYPVTDKNYIMYFWELNGDYYYNMINNIIEEVINDEGEDSLEGFLISKHLIKGLYSYTIEENILVLIVDINNEKTIKDTIIKINQYIKHYFDNFYKLNWKKIYDFIEKKYNILFNYSSKVSNETIVDHISTNMHIFDETNYYFGENGVIIKDYDELNMVVKNINSSTCHIVYCTKLLNTEFIKDTYYNTRYGKIKETLFDVEPIKFKTSIELHNEYYDINPQVIKNLDINYIPQLIGNRIWYGSVSKFNETYNVINHMFYNNTFYNDNKSYLLTSIALEVINYYLVKKFNKEMKIGFGVSISSKPLMSGLVLKIFGHNSKFNKFYSDTIDYFSILSNDITIDIVQIMTEKYKENVMSISKTSPIKYYSTLVFNMINKNNIDILKTIDLINSSIFSQIIDRVKHICTFDNSSAQIFAYGNIEKENLPDFDRFEKSLQLPLPLSPETKEIYDLSVKHPNIDEKSGLVMMVFKLQDMTPKRVAIELIINNILQQPIYDFLRTKSQLGYIVSSSFVRYYNNRYFTLFVQSEKGNKIVIKKITEFFKLSYDIIKNKLKNLNEIKKNISQMVMIKEKNTAELIDKFYSEILNREYMFNRNVLINHQIDKLTSEEIFTYYSNMIINPKIIKIN